MNDSESLQAAAIIGDEAKRFLASEIGRTVIGLAEHEVTNAVEEFIAVDTEDKAKVRDCQLRMAIGTKFKGWLIDIFNDGEESLAVLTQQRKQG